MSVAAQEPESNARPADGWFGKSGFQPAEKAKVIPWPGSPELGAVSSARSALEARKQVLDHLIDAELADLHEALEEEQKAVKRQDRAKDQILANRAEREAIVRAQAALGDISEKEIA